MKNLSQGQQLATVGNSRPFKAIAAMARNRVIGRNNGIPWHLPEDFRWFKQMTTGQIIIMGRKTFESIGRPLPERTTIVLSRTGFRHPGVRTMASLDPTDWAGEERVLYICGGAEIYRLALPFCAELFLTVLRADVEGDTFFPSFEDQFVRRETLLERPEFTIDRYVRPNFVSDSSYGTHA